MRSASLRAPAVGVTVGDADEGDEPGTDGPHHLALHGDRRPGHPLHDGPHAGDGSGPYGVRPVIELTRLAPVRALAPEHGGRIAQLVAFGDDPLVGPSDGEPHPMLWGSFPMVPWAGRVRHGRFRFGGVDYELPIDLPPHAIHGTAYLLPWAVRARRHLVTELGRPWPFGGHACQRVRAPRQQRTAPLEVHAGIGRCQRRPGGTRGSAARSPARSAANAMYALDDEGIPTGQLIARAARPVGRLLHRAVGGTRPALARRTDPDVTSSCTDWVVYDRPTTRCASSPRPARPTRSTSPAGGGARRPLSPR